LVRGEVEVLQGPQGAERGGEWAAEGEIEKVDPSDGRRGVVGAGYVRPVARRAVVGGGGPVGERAGGVAEREPGGDEVVGVGGCARNGLEQKQQEREGAGGIHGWRWRWRWRWWASGLWRERGVAEWAGFEEGVAFWSQNWRLHGLRVGSHTRVILVGEPNGGTPRLALSKAMFS